MDFIIADAGGYELGLLDGNKEIDLDIGDSNDFVLTIDLDEWDEERFAIGNRIYIPDTEYGGIITAKEISTQSNIMKLSGSTWRGMLKYHFMESFNYVANDEAHTALRKIIGNRLDNLFIVSGASAGVQMYYPFEPYQDILSGIEKMAERYAYKLKVCYKQGQAAGIGWVELSLVPVADYSKELEYSQDNKINFVVKDNQGGINHLICLGKGEGSNREVIHLYVNNKGAIVTNKHFTGYQERTAVLDYSNAKDSIELREKGTEQLKQLKNFQEFDMSIEDVDIEVGDIVAGRERTTNTFVKCPVANKILKINGDTMTISYKLKGEE